MLDQSSVVVPSDSCEDGNQEVGKEKDDDCECSHPVTVTRVS